MITNRRVRSSKPNPLSEADVKRMKELRSLLEGGTGRLGIAKYEEKKAELEGLEARLRESTTDIGVTFEVGVRRG